MFEVEIYGRFLLGFWVLRSGCSAVTPRSEKVKIGELPQPAPRHKVSSLGYKHEVTVLKGKKLTASELLPRVHLVISLLKRWLVGTHQGAVSHKHLDYYLDEFTFRFNRRTSMNRGKLFYRLAQQCVAIEPVPLEKILHLERWRTAVSSHPRRKKKEHHLQSEQALLELLPHRQKVASDEF